MKDLKHELGVAMKTGKLVLGYKNVSKLLLSGRPKLVIVSDVCPGKIKESILYYSQLAGVQCIKARETSLELGSHCGKPFPASAIAILDPGDSDILG